MGNALVSGWSQLLGLLGFGDRRATVILLGLDNAGKTTLMYRLTQGEAVSLQPTERAHEDRFRIGGVTFCAWDLGGQEAIRHTWDSYVPEAHAIVFMVDSADRARFEEARDELHDLLQNPALSNTLVAVMLNKVDLPGAASKPEMIEELGLQPYLGGHGGGNDAHAADGSADADAENGAARPPAAVFRTSILQGTGYVEAMQWVASELPA